MQNSALGIVAVFILFVFHVVIRKLRRIEEAIAYELNLPKRLEVRKALQDLMAEAAAPSEVVSKLDESIESEESVFGFEEGPIEAGQTLGMTPAEVVENYDVRVEADGEELKITAKEKEEKIVIPDLPFKGDWRDTPGYKEEVSNGR